jgi:hypothetical protein
MILHIHKLFSAAPGLRRWRYYCFYCIQAALALLTKMIEVERSTVSHNDPYDSVLPSPFSESNDCNVTQDKLKEICELSIQVFEWIELKAAKRCAEVVRHFLQRSAGYKKQSSDGRTRQLQRDEDEISLNNQGSRHVADAYTDDLPYALDGSSPQECETIFNSDFQPCLNSWTNLADNFLLLNDIGGE